VSRGLSVLLSSCALALLAAAPALAAQGSSVTATGTGQARVLPADRHSNASIAAAYETARQASVAGAFTDARRFALEYAHDAGLTLGPLVSVSDQQSNGSSGPGAGFVGPFGPGQFCGTVRQPIFRQGKHRRKLVGFKKVHRCFVPPFASTTLTVTYSAS